MAGGILPTVNHESHQPAVIGAVTLTWVLLLMAFGGRLLCRRLLKMPLRHDDWLLMPAVVFATLESVVTLALSTSPATWVFCTCLTFPSDSKWSRQTHIHISACRAEKKAVPFESGHLHVSAIMVSRHPFRKGLDAHLLLASILSKKVGKVSNHLLGRNYCLLVYRICKTILFNHER